jgi:23S rRNA (adenine2030-N6)-methyltransferase
MNYRHAYHAGNFADVVKHVVLMLLLEHLGRKASGYFMLDTHAGRGRYRLDDPATQKGGEFASGILRARAAAEPPEAVARYLALVERLGAEDGRLSAYPGSPLLARALMRGNDRAAFVELEPGEAGALRTLLKGEGRCAVHERDGYEALAALLPPAERRGLVLVDPPFEAAEEFERLAAGLQNAHARWPGGLYCAWFPLTAGGVAARFLGEMRASGVRKQLLVELTVLPFDSPLGLIGCGLLLVNPPWHLDRELAGILPWLASALAPKTGRPRVEWLVPE